MPVNEDCRGTKAAIINCSGYVFTIDDGHTENESIQASNKSKFPNSGKRELEKEMCFAVNRGEVNPKANQGAVENCVRSAGD